jgi:hypothetical protein
LNYLNWNNLLGNYFFNASWQGKEVFLYLSRSNIQEIFKTTSDYNLLLADHLDEYPDANQTEIDEVIWDDFCTALKLGVNQANCLKPWFDKIIDTWESWEVRKHRQIQGNMGYYPLYLTYLIALILPLTGNDDDFAAINYYDRAVMYLKDNDCFTTAEKAAATRNYDSFRNSFANQFRELDRLWYGLSNWAVNQKQGQLGLYNVKIIGGFAHVGKPFGECIITGYQRQLIPLLFEKANLQVGETLPSGLLASLLARHGQQLLRYPAGKWQAITANDSLLGLLIDIVSNTYTSWTGSVRPDYGNEKEAAESQSVFNAYLSVSIDRANSALSTFCFRFFQPDHNDEFEDIEFKYAGQSVTDLTFYHNGWAKKKTPFPDRVEKVLDQKIVYYDALNQLKAVHTPAAVYLFSADASLNDFTSRSALAYAGEYYLLCKNAFKNTVEAWLPSCAVSKDLSHFTNVPAGWCFYVFKDATVSLPAAGKLTLPAAVSLEKITGMRMQGNLYLNLWPVRFQVKGLRPGDRVYALADDGTEKELGVSSTGWYEVTPADFTVWQKFELKTSQGALGTAPFQFQECVMASQWCEPGLDHFGFADAQNRELIPIRGLNVTAETENYAFALSQLYYSTMAPEQPLASVTGEYEFNDVLLYTISCRTQFELSWFSTAYENCALDRGIKSFGSREVKGTLYYYHQMGLLNYDYLKVQRKHLITMNRPTFLNLPMKVAVSSHYQVLLTGARIPALITALINYCQATHGIFLDFSSKQDPSLPGKYFLPQVITLKARTRQAFATAAAFLNITYQQDIYYPLSLVKHAPSIRDFDSLLPGLVLPGWQDYSMLKTFFDKETLEMTKTTGDIDTSAGLAEYYPGTYQVSCILWKEGIAHEIDKNWGRYYMFFKMDRKNILAYRAATGELFVPVGSGLPKMLARALCLMTGLAPALVEEKGKLYHVYRLPDQLEWNIMNDKLNQRNRI